MNGNKYVAAEREAREYLAFINRKQYTPKACSCKHGHYDCSDVEGGECLDEMWHNLSEEAKGIV